MNPLTVPLTAQAKAVIAAVIAGLSAFLPLMPDGFQPADAVTAAIAALIAYAAVFEIPNARTDDTGTPPGGLEDTGYQPRHRRPDTGTVAGLPADDPDGPR